MIINGITLGLEAFFSLFSKSSVVTELVSLAENINQDWRRLLSHAYICTCTIALISTFSLPLLHRFPLSCNKILTFSLGFSTRHEQHFSDFLISHSSSSWTGDRKEVGLTYYSSRNRKIQPFFLPVSGSPPETLWHHGKLPGRPNSCVYTEPKVTVLVSCESNP